MLDAHRDAELVAFGLHATWSGERCLQDAMSGYQLARRGGMPIFGFTSELATLEPPSPEQVDLFRRIEGNRAAMDAAVSINAATVSPADFVNPAFLGPLLAA